MSEQRIPLKDAKAAAEIQTLDDLSRFVSGKLESNPSYINNGDSVDRELAMRFIAAPQVGNAKLYGSGEIEEMAKTVNEYIKSTKSEWNNIIKEIRDSRMAVNTEVSQIAKMIDSLDRSKERADAIVESLNKLKACLDDPVLKGVLK